MTGRGAGDAREDRVAVVAARDLLTRARLEEGARAAGYTVRVHAAVPDPEGDEALVLVDLDMPGAIDRLGLWREVAARVVGFISHVDRAGRAAAEAAGCEVLARGETVRVAEILSR